MEGKKNFLDDISKEKPESFRDEVFTPVHKGPGRFITAAIILLVIAVGGYFVIRMKDVKVPDMSDWKLTEVQTWASKYHDNTILQGIYSKEAELNSILSQDIVAGKRINGSSSLTVTYSLGADPNETITLPDIKTMTLTDLNTWIDENSLSGITIETETSQIVPKDSVISYEFVDGSEEAFLRKNRMVIYVSSGEESTDTTIEMPDLYGKTKAEVMQWAEEQQVKVTINEEFNQYVDYGKVYAQSINAATKMTRNDPVSVSISRGAPIPVPDFTGMSRSEASDLATLNGIKLFYKMVISDQEADSVLSQDVEAGSEIDVQQVVSLIIAKEDGKILVPDFIGLTSNEANELAGNYGLKVFMKNKDELGNNAIVASQSVKAGTKVENDKLVTLKLEENTQAVTVPDFVGLSKNAAVVLAQNQGITIAFNEVESGKIMNQTILSQSVATKNTIGSEETVLLDVAVNSGTQAAYLWKMNLNEAKAWALQKGITLNVIDYYSDDYTVGSIYYQSCESGDYIPSNKIMTVYHSLGQVMVDSFIGKTKSDILAWRDEVNSKGANITLTFKADTNTPKSKGTITEQSLYGEPASLDRNIEVWVSDTNKGVLLKDFTGMQLDEFKLWCETNGVKYIVTDYYSDTLEEGTLYGQNYTDTYLPEGEYLRINHSLGKVYVKDFTNQTKSSMVDWLTDVNKKQGNIKITFVGQYYSSIDKGKVIDQDIMDSYVDIGSTIIVMYSLGDL
jgi:beta-lactam-binding protein with PASTA domain